MSASATQGGHNKLYYTACCRMSRWRAVLPLFHLLFGLNTHEYPAQTPANWIRYAATLLSARTAYAAAAAAASLPPTATNHVTL